MQGPKGKRRSPKAYSALVLVVKEGRSRSRTHSNQIGKNIEVRAGYKLVYRPKDSEEQVASQETLTSSLRGGGGGLVAGSARGGGSTPVPLRLAPIRQPPPRICQDFSPPCPPTSSLCSLGICREVQPLFDPKKSPPRYLPPWSQNSVLLACVYIYGFFIGSS